MTLLQGYVESLPENEIFSFPFKTSIIIIDSIKVVILIPPAVDVGLPPINIKTPHMMFVPIIC